MKRVFVFGNPDVAIDSLPILILPELRERFPEINFEFKDPNEEIDFPEEVTVLDTVEGIRELTIFHDLDQFVAVPRVSMHDFDALTNLRLLKKLGKIKSVKIIAVPMGLEKGSTLSAIADRVCALLTRLVQ